MSWLQPSLTGVRTLLVGIVVYFAATSFLGSAAAITMRELWEPYVAGLPLGVVTDYLVTYAGLAIGLGLLAVPAGTAVLGTGGRSITWLVIAAYVLLAPSLLAASWINWFQFLGEDAARSFSSAGTSVTVTLIAAMSTALALFLLWQTDRLQTDVARLRSLGMDRRDVFRYVSGHLATTSGVGAGALALTAVAYGIARGVMAVTGQLDPRSWIAFGAVAAGLIVAAGTVAVVATTRDRQNA